MFKVGDYVVYKGNGVCLIDDIRSEKFGKLDRQDYYVLRLVYDPMRSVVFVPVAMEEAERRMRRPITKEQASAIADEMFAADEGWIFDDKLRTVRFREILERGSAEELMKIVKMLYVRGGELSEAGRRLRASDEAIMKKAETNLFGELAYALGIEYSEVLDHIMSNNP